jgi:hypothetical protein
LPPLHDTSTVSKRPNPPPSLAYAAHETAHLLADERLHVFAPCQPQPGAAALRLDLQHEAQERAAEPFERGELGGLAWRLRIVRQAEGVAAGQLADLFDGAEQLARAGDVPRPLTRIAALMSQARGDFLVSPFIFTLAVTRIIDSHIYSAR